MRCLLTVLLALVLCGCVIHRRIRDDDVPAPGHMTLVVCIFASCHLPPPPKEQS